MPPRRRPRYSNQPDPEEMQAQGRSQDIAGRWKSTPGATQSPLDDMANREANGLTKSSLWNAQFSSHQPIVPASTSFGAGVNPDAALGAGAGFGPTGFSGVGDSIYANIIRKGEGYGTANGLPLAGPPPALPTVTPKPEQYTPAAPLQVGTSGTRTDFMTRWGTQPTIRGNYGFAYAGIAPGGHSLGDETGDRTAEFTQPKKRRPYYASQ